MTSNEKRKIARRERRDIKRNINKENRHSQFDNVERIMDRDAIDTAFKNAKKGVAWKSSTIKYDTYKLRNMTKLIARILQGEPIHERFNHFDLNERGKLRHIRSVNMPERVAQKCLCDEILIPMLTPSLIYDNGACLPFKGTSFAEARLKHHITEYYKEHKTNEGYCLNIDLSKYFDNIDHELLYNRICEFINDTQVRNIVRHFIDSFDEGHHTVPGKSIGLGSQISQIAAIFYPSPVDHFIKEQCRMRYYGRYMDDMYILHKDREILKQLKAALVIEFGKLNLTMNDKKTRIVRLGDGVLFLKGHYILTKTGKILVRPAKSGIKRQRKKILKLSKKLQKGEIKAEDFINMYKSWRGAFLTRFPDSDKLVKRVDEYFKFISGLPFTDEHISNTSLCEGDKKNE